MAYFGNLRQLAALYILKKATDVVNEKTEHEEMSKLSKCTIAVLPIGTIAMHSHLICIAINFYLLCIAINICTVKLYHCIASYSNAIALASKINGRALMDWRGGGCTAGIRAICNIAPQILLCIIHPPALGCLHLCFKMDKTTLQPPQTRCPKLAFLSIWRGKYILMDWIGLV